MRFKRAGEYFIVSRCAGRIKCGRFKRSGRKFRLLEFASSDCTADNEVEILRQVLKACNYRPDKILVFTGEIPGGIFFQYEGVTLPIKEEKAALQFELPQHLLKVPEECRCQFAGFDGETPDWRRWQVYAYPAGGMAELVKFWTMAKIKADEFIYPLFGVKNDEPSVRLTGIEDEFNFVGGEWVAEDNDFTIAAAAWRKILSDPLILPEDEQFKIDEYLDILLVMRFMLSLEFSGNEPAIRAVPGKMRPSRFKNQLMFTLLLLAIIMGSGVWDFIVARKKSYDSYRTISNELRRYNKQANDFRAKLKTADKESKELTRVLKLSNGEAQLLPKLADLSEALPTDVLLTGISYSDPGYTLVLQTESESVNPAQIFKNLNYWKITQVQQRRLDDSLSMITVRLEPAGEGDE